MCKIRLSYLIREFQEGILILDLNIRRECGWKMFLKRKRGRGGSEQSVMGLHFGARVRAVREAPLQNWLRREDWATQPVYCNVGWLADFCRLDYCIFNWQEFCLQEKIKKWIHTLVLLSFVCPGQERVQRLFLQRFQQNSLRSERSPSLR